MTLEEAIKHAEEVAKENQERANSNILIERNDTKFLYDGEEYKKCYKCAEEHRQLAEWLKDYQRLLDNRCQQNEDTIKTLDQEPKTEHRKNCKPKRQTGKWIMRHYIDSKRQGFNMWVCSNCYKEFSYDAETGVGITDANFCPSCGADMRGDGNEDRDLNDCVITIKALENDKPQKQKIDRIEYRTDGNAYKLTISNGKEFEQQQSVNPQEPKTGHWIKYGKLYQCSECKELSCCQGKFCNECGAKMFEPQKSGDKK